ncbi:VOC family protein [Herbidospora sp. NBRC 101105]|uniref:VOC family protein n=1 Tax=Herbidospora sp. NBRC 101105 TaxID=3032195 RepID=UPI0024A28247|nr:VOC family protein [Herbidospora sp. NBRC 101105]GLX93743.1 glyoxalase [Herbidospora sp. NBRC 101105]
MLRGPATITFWADDLKAATEWYTEVLGIEPYFAVPGYVEFRIGDHLAELGLADSRYAPGGAPDRPGGAVVHWHVDDVAESLDRLLKLGATPHLPLTDRGEGFVTAAVADPFGNVLGVMYNPHYLEMLGR